MHPFLYHLISMWDLLGMKKTHLVSIPRVPCPTPHQGLADTPQLPKIPLHPELIVFPKAQDFSPSQLARKRSQPFFFLHLNHLKWPFPRLRAWLDALAFSLSGLDCSGTTCAAMAFTMEELHWKGSRGLAYPKAPGSESFSLVTVGWLVTVGRWMVHVDGTNSIIYLVWQPASKSCPCR